MLFTFLYNTVNLKKYTIVFIIAEVFDFITTYLGFVSGHIEGNPFFYKFGLEALFTFKLLVIFAVMMYFQHRITNKKSLLFAKWLIVVIASLPVIWNSLVLLEIVQIAH
jgi:hypothetical protein